eukprot:3796637-Amphidinium_carterae.1
MAFRIAVWGCPVSLWGAIKVAARSVDCFRQGAQKAVHAPRHFAWHKTVTRPFQEKSNSDIGRTQL